VSNTPKYKSRELLQKENADLVKQNEILTGVVAKLEDKLKAACTDPEKCKQTFELPRTQTTLSGNLAVAEQHLHAFALQRRMEDANRAIALIRREVTK
jgi:hypothetical protein